MCRKQTRLDVKVESGIRNAANRGVLDPYQDEFGLRERNPATATCDHIGNRDSEDRGGLQA